jgi:HSP20 family protein
MEAKRKDVPVAKGEIERMPRAVSPFERMDRMFDDFFGRGWLRPFRFERPALAEFDWNLPKVDVVDREAEIVVRAEVPGVKKEDIEVSVSGDVLTIKGESKHEEKEEKGDYWRSEITRGSFSRTLQLPAAVDEDKVKAEMKDGLLQLTLPKIEKAKRKTIRID